MSYLHIEDIPSMRIKYYLEDKEIIPSQEFYFGVVKFLKINNINTYGLNDTILKQNHPDLLNAKIINFRTRLLSASRRFESGTYVAKLLKYYDSKYGDELTNYQITFQVEL